MSGEPVDLMAALERSLDPQRSNVELEAVAARIRERQATVHERQACPKCSAPVGQQCTHMRACRVSFLKHPHVERLRADGMHER